MHTRGFVVALALWLTGSAATPRAQSVDVTAMLDLYAQGRFDEAIAAATRLPDFGPLRLRFVQDTPGWVAADPEQASRRRAAVAGFIVELAAARMETDWGRLSDLIEWTCAQILRPAGPPTEFERAWHRATTALAGRARVRVWLLGPFARLPHQKPRPPQPDDPPSPRHLFHALERFPDDPHFQLAHVVAWTWGRDSEPLRNVRRNDDGRRGVARPAQLEAVTAFEPLIAIPEIAGEAWIRTGQVHVTVGDHAAALAAFEKAQPLATTLALKYLAHFLAGRSLEALQRPDDAMAAYRRGLDAVPAAESATVALASLLFQRNEHDTAEALIDTTFRSRLTITDPGRLVGYGSFIHWPEIKAAMRAEVR